MKFLIALIIGLGSLSTTGLATEKPQDILFKQYITTHKNYIERLTEKSEDTFRLAFSKCTEKIEFKRLKQKNIVTPFFSTNEQLGIDVHPVSGQWIEHSIATACGQQTRINLMVTAYDQNKIPVIYPLVNGFTKIEPINQSRAENAAFNELKKRPNCASKHPFTNTIFLGYRTQDNKLSAKDQNSGWYEQWITNACGEEKSINIVVLPDARTKYRYVAKMRD